MRWIIRIFLTLLMLAVVAVVGIFFIPTEQIARLASGQFEQATGRTLTITGKVSPSFWPQIGARVEGVSIANADWSKAGPMIEAEALSIGLDPQALFRGDIAIRRVNAIAPVIRLERAADGRVNWDFSQGKGGAARRKASGAGSPASEPQSDGFSLARITLDKGTLSGARLSYTDHGTGMQQVLDAVDLTVALPATGGPADADFAATLNDVRISAAGRIGSLVSLLGGGEVPISLTGGIGASAFEFSGEAGIVPPVASGHVVADLSDMAAIAKLAGASAPDLPEGLGRGKAALEGDISWTAERSLSLTSAVVTLDGNRLSGDVTLTTAGERPKLTGEISADTLAVFNGAAGDKADKASSGGTRKGGPSKPKGWSKEPIDVSGLKAIDAALRLNVGVLELAGARVGPVDGTLTNHRGRAVFDISRMDAYGGAMTGQLVINGRDGLSVGGDLNARGLAMQPLLTDAAGYERLIGTGALSLRFLGSGNSIHAIMSGLSGEGSLAFTDGALIGLDLAGMLRSLDPNYVGEGQKTIFDKIIASHVIENGVLKNADLQLTGPLVSVAGAGEVAIGQRQLDYRVVPTAFAKGDGSGGVSVPLLITGPWHDPDFKLDLAALAKEKLDLDEEALKAKLDKQRKKAERQAKKKAAKELGVDPDSDESLEDAAKRKLQDEALKGLGKLFGGD